MIPEVICATQKLEAPESLRDIANGVRLTGPDYGGRGAGVNEAHEWNLAVAFGDIFLIDAYCIDPHGA